MLDGRFCFLEIVGGHHENDLNVDTILPEGGIRILLIVALAALGLYCFSSSVIVIQRKETYGYVPFGDRADLVADFVAEQFDGELDGCIKRAESSLKAAPKPKGNRRLVPR